MVLEDAMDNACALAVVETVVDVMWPTLTDCPGELPSNLATRREPIEVTPANPQRVELFGDAATGGDWDRISLQEDEDGDSGAGDAGVAGDMNTVLVGAE